jgi:hypothetical protein
MQNNFDLFHINLYKTKNCIGIQTPFMSANNQLSLSINTTSAITNHDDTLNTLDFTKSWTPSDWLITFIALNDAREVAEILTSNSFSVLTILSALIQCLNDRVESDIAPDMLRVLGVALRASLRAEFELELDGGATTTNTTPSAITNYISPSYNTDYGRYLFDNTGIVYNAIVRIMHISVCSVLREMITHMISVNDVSRARRLLQIKGVALRVKPLPFSNLEFTMRLMGYSPARV